MKRFKLIKNAYGSGWEGMHVALDHFFKFQNTEDQVLTSEAADCQELDRNIDELIAELNEIKKQSRTLYKTLKK
jgi:hypothetical protein